MHVIQTIIIIIILSTLNITSYNTATINNDHNAVTQCIMDTNQTNNANTYNINTPIDRNIVWITETITALITVLIVFNIPLIITQLRNCIVT